MKIQSRKEVRGYHGFLRFYKYKNHRSVETYEGFTRINLVSEYTPVSGDPVEAQSVYYLAFGMDDRRFVLHLNHEEASALCNELKEALGKMKPRQIK